jgi:Electron transfer flavoprotein, alpha subunit
MNMALVVMEEGDERRFASFIHNNALTQESIVLWRLESSLSIRAMLSVLEEEWDASPVDTILFPPSITGDELATRLAWRLNGSAVCQILSFDPAAKTVGKAVCGNALIATLRSEAAPF